MPTIEEVRTAIAELPAGPAMVAVFTGGTTGIGHYAAKALADSYARDGSKLRGYIVGRNQDRAEMVMTECRKASPGSDWRFIKAPDLSLISVVDAACDDLASQEEAAPFQGGPPRVDFLCMTHSRNPLIQRETTKEGLDGYQSTLYYSRMRFITRLMPLLHASPRPAHVVSVFAGDYLDRLPANGSFIGAPPDKEYGMGSVRRNVTYMKTLFFEELAARDAAGVSLVHYYPGLVDGPGFYKKEVAVWMRLLWRFFKPLLSITYMTPPEECGQRVIDLATGRYPARSQFEGEAQRAQSTIKARKSTKGEVGGGAYSLWSKGEPGDKFANAFIPLREKGMSEKVWEHTNNTLNAIAEKNAQSA